MDPPVPSLSAELSALQRELRDLNLKIERSRARASLINLPPPPVTFYRLPLRATLYRPDIDNVTFYRPDVDSSSAHSLSHSSRWKACVPETVIWNAILTWGESQREEIQAARRARRNWNGDWSHIIEPPCFPEPETQPLEMILHWITGCAKEALERAERVIDECGAKFTDVEQHIKQLLELMEREYWQTQHPTSPRTDYPVLDESVSLRKGIFKTMVKEVLKLIVMDRSFTLRNPTLEAQFSTTLDEILRLSSWTPSSARNRYLHGLLADALVILNDLRLNQEYHDCLRDLMKQHTALCAFTFDNSDLITTKDPETTAELCKNLRRLAQNLGKIASTKAEQYRKLYENFIAHKEDLSHWLDSASPGKGRSLVDSFTDSLKGMASSMRAEADFWKSQSDQFHKWPNIRETYGRAINAMPPFPSKQPNDDRSSTIPSIHGSVTQNTEPDPQRVPQAAQRVLTTFTDLEKLRVNKTQAFLVKSENSISKHIRETHGYLEFVVDVSEKQVSEPSERCIPKAIVRLAEKALCITKQWNKLRRKVKYWGSFLSMFSKPLAFQTFDMVSGISRDDFLECITATPDTLIHPYVIILEICLRDMWHHFLSRTHFWARVDSDPTSFTSWRLAVLNEI